jgi:ABC-type branched-subunit amino acid transport system substrate-binding protein
LTNPFPGPTRRAALQSAAAAILATTCSAWSQPGRAPARALTVAQIFDSSNQQQDVAKDFLIGSRAAWQDINSQGGLRGRPVQHAAIEVDGTPASLAAAVQSLRDNPACVALSGTVSDPVANQLVALLRKEGLNIAHVAPWLQNSVMEVDERTFPIFAARQEQIGHALKSLSAIGVQEVGAVFASRREHELYRDDAARIATGMKLKLRSYPGDIPLAQLGQQMDRTTPAVLLFIGGTPELVQFTQGLDKQSRQRYVVALADVNLQTVLQMGGAKSTPVIVTQAVPMVTASSVPIVRRYRDVLSRLFDEPPAPLSLAGFIAARYTYEVLADIDGPVTRASALAAFQQRAIRDLGGYRVAFDANHRSATYVTQSMLTADGRVVG